MAITARELRDILKKYDRGFDIIGFGSIWLKAHGGCCGLRYKDQHVGSIPPKIYKHTIPTYCAYDRTINDRGEVIYTDSRPHRNLRQVLKMVAQHLPGKDYQRFEKEILARQ